MVQETVRARAAVHRLTGVLDLVAACVDAGPFEQAAIALCNELATRLGCTRVSFGFRLKDSLHLLAMSHSALVDARSNLATDIRFAMSEATEQGRAIAFPAVQADKDIRRAQEALARRERSTSVLSIPLPADGEIVGALTLQREQGAAFDAATVDTMEALASVVGPLLELKRRDARSPLRHAADSGADLAARIAGPRHTGKKLIAVALASLLLWMSVATGTHRVTAPARLEGQVQRAVVAPLDGYVAIAHARAGDEVREGDVIASLDDRELTLERARQAGELEQLKTQYRGAFAAHDRAEGAVINARIARAEAQVALLDAQLERLQLRSPIDGIIIDGDLSQRMGSPVARGDVLFEVAPLSGYRVVIEVDERDVRSIEPGKPGQLALEGLPDQSLSVTIEQVTPVAQPRDGRNAYRVEARVEAASARLRPGMAGYAKIDVGQRRVLWIWTHRITEWLRIKSWAWLP